MAQEQERMEYLVAKLNEASNAYYNGQSEQMTDYEWDAMFDELKKLEEKTGIILENSPTHNVSADTTSGEKEAHEIAALSLAKTKLTTDLEKWADGKPIWLSWKLDGLTLVVTYDNGKLTKVVTRGDGHIGTNITHLAGAIHGILPKVKESGHLVIRGEAVISYADFEKFRMESEEDYANPRNLASGSLALKEVDEVKKRNIHWIPFTLVYTPKEFHHWGEGMDYLEDLGFKTVEHEMIQNPTLTNIEEVIAKWTKKVTDFVNPYPVDGLVIAYDDTDYAKTGSVTGHHAIRAGYAFKWKDESVLTKLSYIEWSCATSTITPVAVFEPVQLEGTTVKRASLCNISECERLGIGGTGTEIEVIKANKIIPKVIRVQRTEGKLEIPCKCPVCSAPTEIHISEESETKTLRCTNPDCPAKELKKYARFVSKAGMDIDGISEATLATFINEGWIKEFADIYKLEDHAKEIVELDGFGERSMQNLSLSLQKARTRESTKVIYALCIPLVGPDVAKKLLSNYSFKELVDIAKTTDDSCYFAHIDGIGPEKSSTFVEYFHNPKYVSIVDHLLEVITVIDENLASTGEKCKGLTFVVTGDVYQYKNRNELKAYIESQGGKVTGSVSKSTNYLINNDVNSTSSKNQKAKELNIPILSEADFIAQFTNN